MSLCYAVSPSIDYEDDYDDLTVEAKFVLNLWSAGLMPVGDKTVLRRNWVV